MYINMKTLFVCSGNSNKFNIAPFIQSQGDSLQNEGVDMYYFTIRAKGIRGYLKEAKRLKQFLKNKEIDIIHAHYTLSGWTALLACPKQPIVLSLMGTDAYGTYIAPGKISFKSRGLTLLTFLIQPFVNKIICKSKHIQTYVYLKKKSLVIPNGVLIDNISLYNHKEDLQKELNLHDNRRYILFLGNQKDERKNFALVESSIKLLKEKEFEILAPFPVSHNKVIQYMQIADVLIVPSFMEGSPNVVKEAMACNCPVVATDVGDVAWLFGNEPGYFLTDFSPETCAIQIEKALAFSKEKGRTRGRQRLIELGLESSEVAKKIINLYKEVILNK